MSPAERGGAGLGREQADAPAIAVRFSPADGPLPVDDEVRRLVLDEALREPVESAQDAHDILLEAMHQQEEGHLESAIKTLATWIDLPEETSAPHGEAWTSETQAVLLIYACWLSVQASTWHLRNRRVVRAFHHTRCCQRWLGLRKPMAAEDEAAAELWLRLRYDCYLNAAELAQVSEDQVKALQALKECEKAQKGMLQPPDPEAVFICLAEVLLQLGYVDEAAGAALTAQERLRSQPFTASARKAYTLLVALSLEQAAYSDQLSNGASVPRRALDCWPQAEKVWTEGGLNANQDHPGARAAAILLDEMRQVHGDLAPAFPEPFSQKKRSVTLPAV